MSGVDVLLGMADPVEHLVGVAKEVEGRPEGVDDSVWREEARNVLDNSIFQNLGRDAQAAYLVSLVRARQK